MKAGVLEALAHGLAVWKVLDRLGEVIVGAAFSGEPRGDARQNAMQVEAVGGKPRLGGQTKIQNQDGAAGVQNAVDFSEGVVP